MTVIIGVRKGPTATTPLVHWSIGTGGGRDPVGSVERPAPVVRPRSLDDELLERARAWR